MSANDQSAQPCGCDLGALHVCERHASEGVRIDDRGFHYSTMHDRRNVVSTSDAPFSQALGPKTEAPAPNRATTIPTDGKMRKEYPLATGVLDYFPDAIVAVSRVSFIGNQQHNPGQPVHWARGKSMDHADTLLRHFAERGSFDSDGQRHSAKVVWRALAILQLEIEADQKKEALCESGLT